MLMPSCFLLLIPLITARRFPPGRSPVAEHEREPGLFCGHRFVTTWHQQPVDHFNFQQHKFYQQRVLINQDHFSVDEPVIFFYTGNEGDIEVFANNTGFMCETAEEFGAMLVFAEHRYFGQSMPLGDASYQQENLGYLSVEQAMADFAQVVTNIRQQFIIPDAVVIAFGGSYGGMLSAWTRIKYPHVLDGAIASSAPILQFTGMVSLDTFDDIVTQTFESSQPGCSSRIREMFDLISEASLENLSETFNLCEPLQSRDDLTEWIYNAFVYEAMLDYPFEANFIQPLPAWPVNATCSEILAGKCADNPLDCFAAGINVYYNHTGEAGQCNNINGPVLSSLKEDGWNYLACTSMVMPMSSGPHSMFPSQPWDQLKSERMCYSLYGVMSNPGFAEAQYGGDRIWTATNIVFSNGRLDPWSGGGVLQSPSPSIETVMIEGAAHHLDLRASDPSDSHSLKDARNIHRRNIQKWIGEVRGRDKQRYTFKTLRNVRRLYQ